MIFSGFRKLQHGRQAAALIIVLAFVVLLTGLIVAFFSRAMNERGVSNSSANQTKVELFAQGALDTITSDLKEEIAAGSTPSTGITTGTTTIYIATSGSTMVPCRVGTSGTFPTLIKRSASTLPFYAGAAYDTGNYPPSNRACSISSTMVSQNGRAMSTARWNKALLLVKSATAIPSDTSFTPDASFVPPDWIMVARDGTNPTAWDPSLAVSGSNPVLGRYAYTIYDEGALLDMNVAGYPVDSPPASPPVVTTLAQSGPKGVLAYADLTQLPGISTGTSTTGIGLTALSGTRQSGIINTIVGWRNYASATPLSGSFPNYTSGTAQGTSFYNFVKSNQNGFMQTSGTSLVSGQTDKMFLSRQQLMSFLLQGIAASGSSASAVAERANLQYALQYLGTFSRAVNAPTWSPPADALALGGTSNGIGNIYAYKTNADTATISGSGNPNRNIPNVRFVTSGTIKHYDDNGNRNDYLVQAGDSLMQRRFSLAKLAWLTPTGPKSGISDQAIQDCFGLKWNSGGTVTGGPYWRWEYVGPTGINPRSSIETLDLIGNSTSNNDTTPREPNFFELLKAGILRGSLGRDPGAGIDVNGGWGVYASKYDTFKTESNLQILQIGANIIDQFDSDSFPTAIYLKAYDFVNPPPPTPIDELAINTVYGIENLPYMTALLPIALGDPTPQYVNDPAGKLKEFLQPVLWNLHQAPASLNGSYPTGFRCYAYGKAMCVWSQPSTKKLPLVSEITKYDDGTGVESSTNPQGGKPGEIYFTDTRGAASAFYSKPQMLTTSNVDLVATPKDNYYDAIKWGALPGDSGSPNQFAGFSVMAVTRYNADPTLAVNHYIYPDTILAYFSIQYKGPDGKYHPYNFISRIPQSPGKYIKPGPEVTPDGVPGTTTMHGWGPAKLDPRTDRFSVSTNWLERAGAPPPPMWFHTPDGSGASPPSGIGIPYYPPDLVSGWSPFYYLPTYNPQATGGGHIEYFFLNDKTYTSGGAKAYYFDQDGVVRYADGYRLNATTGDGGEIFRTTDQPGSAQQRRPVILDRPFRSVAELGFAFRDLPYKSLDFWSSTSADSALLDLFAITDQPVTVAGQINLNNAPAPVLRAIIAGGAKSDALGVQISGSDAQILSNSIAADFSVNGPYSSRADLATRLGPIISGGTGSVAFNTTVVANANWANKAYAEAPIRALADVTNTRTWNLMIDVIAQTGNFTTTNATDLNRNFMVQGERRYWLHIAIDRFTGKVVDQQLEPVYE